MRWRNLHISSVFLPIVCLLFGSVTFAQTTASKSPVTKKETADVPVTANVVDATKQYNLGGKRILSNSGRQNLFAGDGAGAANTVRIITESSNAKVGAVDSAFYIVVY